LKVERLNDIALLNKSSHTYGVSLAILDHSVTFHPTQVNTPLRNHSQTDCYSICLYPTWMEGWVDVDDWLYTEMVYPPTDDGHPSEY